MACPYLDLYTLLSLHVYSLCPGVDFPATRTGLGIWKLYEPNAYYGGGEIKPDIIMFIDKCMSYRQG